MVQKMLLIFDVDNQNRRNISYLVHVNAFTSPSAELLLRDIYDTETISTKNFNVLTEAKILTCEQGTYEKKRFCGRRFEILETPAECLKNIFSSFVAIALNKLHVDLECENRLKRNLLFFHLQAKFSRIQREWFL